MKKRYLIPAVATAALAGLYFHGSNIQKTCVPGNADYEAGTGICSARNAASAVAQAKRDADDAKFKVNRHNVAMLALDCEKNHIRPSLKDPNSFRELSTSHKETVDQVYVQVNYTATNGFGGRVQGSKVCTYSL